MSSALLLVVSLLLLGYLSRKLERYPELSAEVLNRFVIDVCVPATLLKVLPTLEFRPELLVLLLVPWSLAAVGYGVARAAGRWLELDRATETTLFLCCALGNTSFLGFPLCRALLGPASLPLAAVYDQLGSFMLLSFVAPLAIARATSGARPSVWSTAQRVARFPPFIALVLGLLPLPRPPALVSMLEVVSAALVPVAIFAVGLRLRATPPRALGAFAIGLGTKLALFPLLAWALAAALSIPRPVLEVAVLESAMPAMVTAGAIAAAAGLAPELAAALVGWGILVSLLTVPAWAALLTWIG